MSVINLLNRANFIKVNGIHGEGPLPLPTFPAPLISRLRITVETVNDGTSSTSTDRVDCRR